MKYAQLRRRAVVFLAASMALLIAPKARGQWGVWAADSLLAAGRLNAAESAYYAAVRVEPRGPMARSALGRFLAARGALVAGSVLLEEARDFGADSAAVARWLSPLYSRMHDFRKLVALGPRVMSPAEHRRARWLAEHPPASILPDSIVLLSYRPAAGGEGIGTVLLRLERAEFPALIDPRVSGLVLPSASADLRSFGADGQLTIAIAPIVRLGAATLTNVPVAIGGTDVALLGFDVLARHSPSFDPARGSLLLRRERSPRLATPRMAGTHIPALFDTNGMRLLLGGRWWPSTSEVAATQLGTRAWSWDAPRGDVVLMP